jgi:hypothetical protein
MIERFLASERTLLYVAVVEEGDVAAWPSTTSSPTQG